MRTLKEAWARYESTRVHLNLMGRIGRRYWPELPWEGAIGRDDHFRDLEGPAVANGVALVLRELDDLAVSLLFSVFEASVRERVQEEVKAEIDSLRHPALVKAAARFAKNLEEGSFYTNVLEHFKGAETSDLVEQVNPVRKYRNWVAHGRRVGERPVGLGPREAFERLQEFLDRFSLGPRE